MISASPITTNGETSPSDLFALSDEQILQIAPESTQAAPVGQPFLAVQGSANESAERSPAISTQPDTGHSSRATELVTEAAKRAQPLNGRQAEMAVPLEPPAWLAVQMNDAWAGEEAREFWDGVQQARSEAEEYRAAIASPEDARALKELYPGGVSEARATAERARLLDDVDRAYFGAAGNSTEQTSASRVQLAQRMLWEDPAAFRDMVETGIKVLQQAAGSHSYSTKSLASAVSPIASERPDAGATASSVAAQHAARLQGNATPGETAAGRHAHESQVSSHQSLSGYAAFERAANEDLERSVGSAIERTLAQALPSFEQHNTPGQSRLGEQAGAQCAAPLRERLTGSVRAEVEKALQGDRQLGEQVTQILAARRFDDESRAQIVRLIGERAQQLVPGAAKRVLNEWTQTTLAAHRGRAHGDDAASARSDVALASVPARAAGGSARQADASGRSASQQQSRRQDGGATRSPSINYRKLSDEQILEM
jgi:hypothetical protein